MNSFNVGMKVNGIVRFPLVHCVLRYFRAAHNLSKRDLGVVVFHSLSFLRHLALCELFFACHFMHILAPARLPSLLKMAGSALRVPYSGVIGGAHFLKMAAHCPSMSYYFLFSTKSFNHHCMFNPIYPHYSLYRSYHC